MKPILIELTPEESHNLLVLLDLSLKHPDGGVKVLNAVKPILDKIQAAVALANEKARIAVASDPVAGPGCG